MQIDKIPILHLPKNDDIIICSMLNKDNQSIDNFFIGKNVQVLEQNKIDNWPKEKCYNCHCDLTICNLSFVDDNKIIKLYCHECCKDKGKKIKLSFSDDYLYLYNKLINSLESYLDQYKNDSNAFCIKMMNQLISKTKYLFYLHEAFKSEDAFMNYILYSESYIKSLTLYIDIVSEFKMENLYLFLKNLFVISAVKYDEYSLKIIYKYYLKNINCFNIFGITSCFLEKLSENNEDDMFMLKEMVELKREKAISELDREIYYINKDLSSVAVDLEKNEILWLKKKIRINELKEQIIEFLRDYKYSYNYISSKKVLERKFINWIIYILFKYHYKRFEIIEEDDYILNGIMKELEDMIKFLNVLNDSRKQKLIEKLNKELKNLEKRKKSNNWLWKKFSSSSPYEKNKKNRTNKGNKNSESNENNEISLNEDDKQILNNYLSSNIDESFKQIKVSKVEDSTSINYDKIQVIVEFLFFIRDKTISIIHLLNEVSTLFFDFLNQNKNSINTLSDKNEKDGNIIIENSYKDEKDDEKIDELTKNFNINFSSEYEDKNKELIENISIESKKIINCRLALNYIFSNNLNNNYQKEIEYLYKNIILPERAHSQSSNEDLNKQKDSYHSLIQNNIETLYTKISNEFKDDPSYDIIINYFKDSYKKLRENKYSPAPKNLLFYEKNVDNFIKFKEIFIIKQKFYEYLTTIESDKKTLEMMELIKEKYILIKKEIKKYLKPNIENYKQYYEELKAKNPQYIVNNYEVNDLINDLNNLIPVNETMDITIKDKKNFYLILYLFQKNLLF